MPISSAGFGAIPARRRAWRRWLMATGAVVVVAAGLIWWYSRPPPLYTTGLRLAVMPLENKAHPNQDRVMKGMWEVAFHILDDASRSHDSMWVIPNRLMRYAEIGEDAQARNLFGVNRIVTGGLQRFEGGQVLLLVLKDAESLEQLKAVRVPFDPRTSALADSLPEAIAQLIGLDGRLMAEMTPYIPRDGQAAHEYLRGVGALQDRDHEDALAAFGATTAAAPVFAMGWTGLGQAQWLAHVQTADGPAGEEVTASLERGVALAPGAWRPLFELGDMHRKAGEYQPSLTALFAAAELSPDNLRIVGILARVLRYEDRLVKAEQILQSAIKAHPDYFDSYRQLGNFNYFTDEKAAALTCFNRVLTLAPDDPFSMNTIGGIFQERGEFLQAREMFERAYSLLPNYLTCSNIGLMLFYEGKFRESASYYELSMEWDEAADATSWANWAKALYWAEGGREESIPKFEKAIELTWEEWRLSPGDPLILGDLIDMHAMIGDREMTLELIAKADFLAMEDGKLYYQIGNAYELLGNREAALRYLARAVRLGFSVEEIIGTPELGNLVTDPRFVRMVTASSGPEQAPADRDK